MKPLTRFISALMILLLTFASQSDAAERVILQLKWKHQFQFAGYYAAVEKGYYAEEGLDVTLIEGKPGGNEIEEVISGRAHYGVGMSDVLLARLKDKPVVVLANIFQHSPIIFLVLKSSGISSPQDLFGKRVMMTPGYKSAENQAILINEGVPIENIKIVKPTWNLDDLISGKVDAVAAYISAEPYYLKKRGVPFLVISPTTYGIDFYGENLFTTEHEINEYPNRVVRFKRASLKGWEYALENQEEVIDIILSKYTSGRKNITKEFLMQEAASYKKLILPQFVKIGHMNPGRWKHIAETYAHLNMVDKDYSLKGFLYEPLGTKFDWSHWSIKWAAALVCLGFAATIVLFFFNRRLNIEINERKKSENALQDSERKYRTLFDQAPDAIFLDDNEDRVVDANPSACKLMGYSRDELLKITVADRQAPENRGEPGTVIQNEYEKYQGLPFETVNIHKDGTRIPVEVKTVPLKMDGLFLSLIRDITDRKKTEKEISEKTRFNQTLLDAMPCVALLLRPSTREIVASNAAARKFGAFPGETCFSTWAQRDEPCPFCLAPKVWSKGEEQHLEVGALDIIWDAHWIPIQEDLYLHFAFDITEKRQLEDKFQRSQKMESLGLMAGGIAHDLNNILSGLVGYPELILLDLPKDSPFRSHIETIKDSGKRAADVVTDLLTIARGVATDKEILNLNDAVKEYLDSAELHDLITMYSLIKFETNLDPDLLNSICSYTHIRKSLANLVTNAVEAIKGKGTVKISTMNRYLDEPLTGYARVEVGEYAVLSITDDGLGMSDHDLERIFEPFYTKKMMGRSGTGLGLAVVWNTIQDHGGYINVDTSEGGTTFELYFPVTRDEAISEKIEISMKEYIGQRERILVVDDEKHQREIASNLLRRLDYKVEAVSSGEEAIQYLKDRSVDLVVLDMIMPKGINGCETYEEIIKIHPKQKAIIASGFSETVNVKKAQSLGAGRYIKKPYTMKTIGIAVKEELEK